MKKAVLLFLVVLQVLVSSAQNDNLSAEAKRCFSRGVAASNMAKTTDDFKLALSEFQEAARLAPDNAEVFYRMGLCCEAVAKDDNAYYGKALEYYKRSLSISNGSSNAAVKELLQGKIHEMEYAVERATKENKNKISPETLCGKWRFHDADGTAKDMFDVEIKNEQGLYKVKYGVAHIRKADRNGAYHNAKPLIMYKTGDVKFAEDGTIRFTTIHNDVVKHYDGVREHSQDKTEFVYEMKLENGWLKGIRKCIYHFWATGNSDCRTVREAVRNGRGTVIADCQGDCGMSDVYFTK